MGNISLDGGGKWLIMILALGWLIHKTGFAQRLFGVRRRDDPD